jgi:hypothetical protein
MNLNWSYDCSFLSVCICSEYGRIAALVAFGSMPADPEATDQYSGTVHERSTAFTKEIFLPPKLVRLFHYGMWSERASTRKTAIHHISDGTAGRTCWQCVDCTTKPAPAETRNDSVPLRPTSTQRNYILNVCMYDYFPRSTRAVEPSIDSRPTLLCMYCLKRGFLI